MISNQKILLSPLYLPQRQLCVSLFLEYWNLVEEYAKVDPEGSDRYRQQVS
jgi:hypothetical protein